LIGGEFEYDGDSFLIDRVDPTGEVIKVEAGADVTDLGGQRVLYFDLRVENLEDIT
jgi:hypothetical protein